MKNKELQEILKNLDPEADIVIDDKTGRYFGEPEIKQSKMKLFYIKNPPLEDYKLYCSENDNSLKEVCKIVDVILFE